MLDLVADVELSTAHSQTLACGASLYALSDLEIVGWLTNYCTCTDIRVRVQLLRHFKTCTTDIELQNECAHVGLSVHVPA